MTEVGSTYGKALYDLAREENLTDTLRQELFALDASFRENPDFLRLLSTPALSKPERCQVVDDSFRGKLHPYVVNFLKILTEKGYARQFPHCCAAFKAQYDLDHGILSVIAVTAQPLTESQSARLAEKLAAITGKQIELTNKLDPKCLGGVRLDYDGKRLDGTVAQRLKAISGLLSQTVM